jgi:tRNA nucleotidyltransferase (CCA-adding enzyme)
MIKQKHEDIEKKVLERITPNRSDRAKLEEVIKNLKTEVIREIKKRNLPASIEIVGSTAKDTFLKDKLDIDLFISHPTSFSKEDLGKNTLSIGRKILENIEECYAEHPYVRGDYHDTKVEIVPCYKIERASQKLSAVDRTPLHTKYIKKHLQEKQKKEVRLFKQFLIGTGCYGAEAEIEGFSGYLCEILIIKYGAFKKLLQHAQNWKFGEKLALSKGSCPSFDTPLTFIDPVDRDRNVASALSKEKFDLFIKACKEYRRNPSTTFFFQNKVKPWSLQKIKKEIKKEGTLYIAVKIPKPDIIDENLYPQVRKAIRSIKEVCERNDFNVYDTVFHVDEKEKIILMIVKTDIKPLSEIFVHTGPPVKLKKNTSEFIQKWENSPRVTRRPYEENGRIYVELKREYTNVKEFLKDNIREISMGKHLDKIRDKKYEFVELENLLTDKLRVFWTNYLDGKMPWER